MALNSFHKYVSAIRKSKSFKPVYMPHPLGLSGRVVAKCTYTRFIFGSMLIKEAQEICGDGIVITTEYGTQEMIAYNFWL